MAYKGQSTKYGNKTTAQIAAGLSNPQVGDTVFNTDYAEIEWYNGSTWLSNNSVQMTAGVTVVEGNLVSINTSGQAILITSATQSTIEKGVGVVQYGGTTGSIISVRTSGVAKCLAGGAITLGNYAIPGSGATAGRILNTATPGSFPSNGNIGRNLQSASSGNLTYVFLTFLDRY